MAPSSDQTWRYVRGVLETADGVAGADLAFAQDGRIVTITQAVGGGGVLGFTALLPTLADASRPSPIEVLLIREDAVAGKQLERLATFPVSAP
jgi:hypothetical protein